MAPVEHRAKEDSIESSDEDSSRGSSKEDSREGQVMTPVEGPAKKTP